MIADSELTTHTHFGVQTDNVDEVLRRGRYAYTRYFNSKYGRRGRLGEKHPYILETDGLLHIQAMVSYIFRQGLHHGLASTSFAYPHSSVNAVFREDLGKYVLPKLLPREHWYKYIPDSQYVIPSGYRMTESGLLLREDVIDTAYVQMLYITPRNFLYQMNRLSDDNWKTEQLSDNSVFAPITLESLEPKYYHESMRQMLINESGRSVSNGITDLELCSLIDNRYVFQLGKKSIYDLSVSERQSLGNDIYRDMKNGVVAKLLRKNRVSPEIRQIRRCVVI